MAYSDTGREKQSGRHDTSLISRYWKPAAIAAASFTQIFPPLFGCLCDPCARRKLAGISGSIAGQNRQADLRRKRRNCVWQPIPWGLGGCSAVDGDLRPGDVAALVGEQECHQLCNLLRRPVTVHRHLLHPLVALLGRAERDHVGVDWTGMNRVHPDLAVAEVDRCRLGHTPQRPFGRGIGEGPGRAFEARDGRDIHDGPSATSRRASAAPWPRAPPLTSTTLLSKRAMSAPPRITDKGISQIGRPGSKTLGDNVRWCPGPDAFTANVMGSYATSRLF